MIQRMVTSAVFAGVAAGLFAALLHFAFVQKYILLGEAYESGTAVHFAGVATKATEAEHDHHADLPQTTGAATAHTDGHDHAPGAEHGAATWQRDGLTVLFLTLLYSAYGLVLVAGFALAREFGQRVGPREGVLWGIAGFAALHLAPALGLSPELPGTAAAALSERQIWWGATAVCTAAGLALIGYGRKPVWIAGGALLAAVPHLVGAPELEGFSGVAPPEVASAFAARSLAVGLTVWAVLGGLAAWVWNRTDA